MTKFPIDFKKIDCFVKEEFLFEKTEEHLRAWLEELYKTNRADFERTFNASLDKVMAAYIFDHSGISFSRSYEYDVPMDYISVWIRIFDNEHDYLAEYTAFFDSKLNCIDDRMR